MKTKSKKAIITLILCVISTLILIFSIRTVQAEETKTDMRLNVGIDLEKYINYDISEKDKGTIVQFNINTEIGYGEEKKYIPFKETETIISLNKIEEKYPSEVKVIEKRTEITNGKIANKEANYEYDKNTGKVRIKANNINENGELIYSGKPQEKAKDEYIVICYYDTFSSEKPSRAINIDVTTKAILNTEENKEIVGEQKLEENVSENIGEIISIKYNTEDIYNGNIKSNIINKTEYATVYKEKEEIVISKKEAQEKLTLTEDNSFLKVYKNEDEENVRELANKNNLVYKSTKFLKDNIIQILGEEGKVEILDKNNNIIFTIDKNSNFEEDGTITINYPEDMETVTIKTSNILKEGILEIENTKEIKSTMLDSENIRIKTITKIEGIKEEKIIEEIEGEVKEETKEETTFINKTENFADIKEAQTDIKFDISNTKWTNKEQNEVEFNIYLNADNIQKNMFKNPSIRINLPEQVEKIILKDTSMVYGNGLELEQPYIEKDENGKWSLIANLKGSQTKYNEGSELGLSTNIKISTTIILKKEIENDISNIDMEYSNEYDINNKKEFGNRNIEIQIEKYKEEKPLIENQEQTEENQKEEITEENKEENKEEVLKEEQQTEEIQNIENADKITLEVLPTKGDTKINEGDTVYEGEYIKYNIKIKNTSDEKIENLKIKANIAEGTGDSKGYHFEVVVKSFQSSYWQAAVQGINQACDELGVTANTTGPNAESDIADQVNMLNNAINKNPDGIALAACDQNSVLGPLKTALEKKIPVVCFDSGVPDAPEGSVYATVVTDNEQAGGIAAEHIYPAIKDKLGKGQVRVGEVNQDATSANISERGMGFINKFIELAKADGFTVAVVGNDFYVNQVKDNGDQASADVILEVAVPAQTTVELCATEASNIMNKDDTIAMFGSNQVSAEGVLTANQNLNKLGTDDDKIVAAGFDAGSVIKAAVKDGTLLGAVTQSPLMQGKISIETLAKICDGESVEDVTTDGYWYDSTNMDDEDISPNLYD